MKSNEYGILYRVTTRGSELASILKMSARLAAFGLALTKMGCLVTESVAFPDEANVPPSIVSSAGAMNPLDKIVRFNVDGAATADGGPAAQEVRFEVQIRDPNLSQSLQAKIFVDATSAFDRPVEGTQLVRPFEFTIPGSLLPLRIDGAGACHKVELLVSGNFRFGLRVPVDPVDIAQAVWWVRSTTSDGTRTVDMALCN